MASGVPCRSTIRWCSLPGRPRPTDEGPVRAPSRAPDMRAVDRRVAHLQQARPPQFSKKHFTQTRPHPGPGPVPQPPPGRHPNASGALRGHVPQLTPCTTRTTMPQSAARSPAGSGPGSGDALTGRNGSSGATRSQKPSDTSPSNTGSTLPPHPPTTKPSANSFRNDQ